MFASRPPRSPLLKPFVEAFWTSDDVLDHEFERVLPNGRVQLFINLHEDELRTYAPDGTVRRRSCGTALQGPQLRPVVIDRAEQRSICGVLFAPGGAMPCLQVQPSELGEALVAVSDLSWRQGGPLRERLLEAGSPNQRLDVLEAAFLRPPPTATTWDEITHAAAGLLRSGLGVRQVADRCATSPKTLIMRFRERTGMTPKTYARVERFQRIVRSALTPTSWANVALDAGFADQAHMVREFRHFSGTSPARYRPHSPQAPNHTPIGG